LTSTNSGNLINDGQVSDFTVTGNIPANPSLSGTLLTGKIIEFGYQNTAVALPSLTSSPFHLAEHSFRCLPAKYWYHQRQ